MAFLSYEEASKWAISQKISSQSEFTKMAKEGNLPTNIPKQPYTYYARNGGKWKGWGEFLGKNIVSKIETIKPSKTYLLLFNKEHQASNIISFIFITDTIDNIKKSIISAQNLKLIKGYEWNEHFRGQFDNLMTFATFGSENLENRTVPYLASLLFELDSGLAWINWNS